MSEAPSRLKVFEEVDGRSTARDIAVRTGRHENNVRRDLAVLRDAGLIQEKGEPGARLPIYEKVPLARTVPKKYFEPIVKRPVSATADAPAPRRRPESKELVCPDENEILRIARHGEDQLYEFKAPGTEMSKMVREIGAMLNTSQGGMIFYGIDDDGTIVGTDKTRQDFDQPLQNSIKNAISPAAVVKLFSVRVLGSDILVVIVPPWNRSDVYHHRERIDIRHGTNVQAARPEQARRLYRGEIVL